MSKSRGRLLVSWSVQGDFTSWNPSGYEPMWAVDELAAVARRRAEALAEFRACRRSAVRMGAGAALALAGALGADPAWPTWACVGLALGLAGWVAGLLAASHRALAALDRARGAA